MLGFYTDNDDKGIMSTSLVPGLKTVPVGRSFTDTSLNSIRRTEILVSFVGTTVGRW